MARIVSQSAIILYSVAMKNIFFISLFCVFLFSPVYARAGLGVQGSATLRSELPSESECALFPAAALTVAFDTLPWVFAVQAPQKTQLAGFTADNWFVYQPLCAALNFFLFYGSSGGASFGEDAALFMGPRAGLGINAFFCKSHMECFFQAAWNPIAGVYLSQGAGSDAFFVRPLVFPASAGIRFWN